MPFNYDIESESCTPLRPSYAADLQDDALTKAGYDPKDVDSYPVNFTPDGDGNGMFCAVNNQLFTFPDPKPLVMTLGKIVEWQFNAVSAGSVHLHLKQQQQQQLQGRLQPEPSFLLSWWVRQPTCLCLKLFQLAAALLTDAL